MKYFKQALSFLLLLISFSGCLFSALDKECENKLDGFRKKDRDPRLFGKWYNDKDRDKLHVDDLKVDAHYFKDDGFHNQSLLAIVHRGVSDAWHTDKDTLYIHRCKDFSIQLFTKAVYKVNGDTLRLSVLSKDRGLVNITWTYVRLKE